MAGEDEIVVRFRADTSALEKQVTKATSVDKKNIDNAAQSFSKLGQASAKALQVKNIKEAEEAVKKVDNAVKATATDMQKTEKSTLSLKAQLKNLKNEIGGLEKGSARFNQLTKEAAALDDKIGDINRRIKALSSDTARFDAFAQGITGLAGGFAAAQAGAALFGEENQDLQRSMLKVQAAMTAVTGLQSLVNTLNKDSAFSTIFLTKAQDAATTSTTFLGRAFGKLALALLNNPITVVVVGLVAAIAAIKAFSSTTTQAEKDQKALNEAMDAAQEAADEYVTKLESVIDSVKKRYDIEKRLAEANGKSVDDITRKQFEAVNKTIEGKLDEAAKAREFYNKRIADLEEQSAKKALEIEEINKNGVELITESIAYIKSKRLQDEKYLLDKSIANNKVFLSELGDLERQGIQASKDNQTELTIFEAQEAQKRIEKARDEYKKRIELENNFRKQLEDLQVKNLKDENDRAVAAENYRFERAVKDAEKTAVNKQLRDQYIEQLEIEHNNNLAKIDADNQAKVNQKINDDFDKYVEQLDANQQKVFEIQELSNEELQKQADEKNAMLLAGEIAYNEARLTAQQQYLDAFQSISNSLTALGLQNTELQKAIAIIQIEVEQGKALASAISGAAQAATFTGPAAPFIVGAYIAQAIAAVFAGFAQARAVINSTPSIPGFAEGIEYVNGPGTAKSDSIPARLSKGERIVTADKNAEYWDELSAIHNGNYERFIQEKYVIPAIRNAIIEKNGGGSSTGKSWKGDNIEFGLEKNRRDAHRDALMIASVLKRIEPPSKRKY